MEAVTISTSQIPYEIRRNPLNITLFRKSGIKDKKLLISPSHKLHKDMNKFVCRTENITTTETQARKPFVYVYRTMSLDNYGHFIIDNLIPLYKMIVLTQGYDFHRDDVLFCFLKAPAETARQQTLSQKQLQLLSVFTSHPVRFIDDMPDMQINNLVVPFLGLGKSISFMKWTEYKINNEQKSVEFLKNFQQRILAFLEIKINSPEKNIFLSRNGAKHRKVLNEDEVVKSLSLEAVSFQNKTISEELQLFIDSNVVVTPYGAGIVGCFFLQPRTKCIIVHPKGFGEQYDFPQIYVIFMQRLGIDVTIYHNTVGIAGKNIFRNRDANMSINIEELKSAMKNE